VFKQINFTSTPFFTPKIESKLFNANKDHNMFVIINFFIELSNPSSLQTIIDAIHNFLQVNFYQNESLPHHFCHNLKFELVTKA